MSNLWWGLISFGTFPALCGIGLLVGWLVEKKRFRTPSRHPNERE